MLIVPPIVCELENAALTPLIIFEPRDFEVGVARRRRGYRRR